MAEFKKKKKYSFWYAPLTLVLLFLLLIFFSYRIINIIKKQRETVSQRNLAADSLKSLQNRGNSLIQDIDKVNTPEGIESVIRNKYQVVKPNEKMVVIINNKQESSSDLRTPVRYNFWDWIKDIFKK